MTLGQTLQTLWDPLLAFRGKIDTDDDEWISANKLLNRLDLRLKQRMQTREQGIYRSPFRDRGLDLAGIREYQPGDDIRHMDWNVLARTGTPHVKEHYAERHLHVWFVVDRSASMAFGQRRSKWQYARQLVGLLGLLALNDNHRLGLIQIEANGMPIQVFPPKSGRMALETLLHAMAQDPVASNHPASALVFPDVAQLIQPFPRSWVVLMSDFAFLDSHPHALAPFSYLADKHPIQSLLLLDPVERDLVYGLGWLPLKNSQYPDVLWVNTTDRWMIRAYRRAVTSVIQRRVTSLSLWSRAMVVHTAQSPLDTVCRMTQEVRR
jgi:uncharacterized protein (DUF58 family)